MEANVKQFRWQKSAACLGVPSYIFFPDETKLPSFKESVLYKGKTYRDFCGGCKVRNVCKEFAILHDAHGAWGGTTKLERDKLYPTDERREMRNYKAESGKYFPLHGEGRLEEEE